MITNSIHHNFLMRLILQIKSKHLFVLINLTYKTYILNYGGLIAIFTSKELGGGRAPTKLARGGDMSLPPPSLRLCLQRYYGVSYMIVIVISTLYGVI